MLRLLTMIAVAATFAVATPVRAAGDKPLMAVLPFNGPQAKQAEAVVVRVLRKKAQLIPAATWKKSANKLFAHTHSAEDISAVADDLGVQIVITGVVKRDGKKWELSVGVRDAKTGKAHDRLRYPLAAPQLDLATLTLLAREVSDAFDAMVSGTPEGPGGAAQPPSAPEVKRTEAKPPAPRPEPRAEPSAEPIPEARTEPKPGPTAVARSDERPRRATGTQGAPAAKLPSEPLAVEEPPPPVLAPRSSATTSAAEGAGSRRPLWAPYFDLDAGATISGRSFDYDPASQPKFSSGVVAGVRGDATVYPLASTWNKAGGAFSGLGLGATVDKPFWPASTSKQDPMQKYATSELRVEGGLRWHIVLQKRLPRPELLVAVGGGAHSFSIGKDAMGQDVGPADVNYKYASFGGGARIHFAEWSYLWVMFDYHLVFDSGPVADPVAEYGPVNTFGLRVRGGLVFFAYKGFKIGGEGFYERFSLKFVPGTTAPAKAANSGLDQYFGGVITVGYVL